MMTSPTTPPPEKPSSLTYGAPRSPSISKIWADIIKEEDIFIEERNEWVAYHRDLYPNKNEFFVERCSWETKFNEDHLQPLYKMRCDVAKGISDFWHTAMIANKMLQHDKEALYLLNDIKSRRTSNLKGFELKFTFDTPNPYFKNNFLTKTYELAGDNESISLKAIGKEIDWCPSKNLSQTVTGKSRESFFNFFDTVTYHNRLSFDEEADELKGKIPMDYVIGTIFRDKIIPHAISWYKFSEEDDSDGSDGSDM
ncbi:hypothetical protein M0R45_003116 [Rubus argutus]|uniref:Uncharacterized protein n=1 Tax=Rubus argutus TaxID=59490 RepID=A0AAW1YFG7_RUBAR